jgi:hypothetical protein
MSYFNSNDINASTSKITGAFTEKEYGHNFEFRPTSFQWALDNGLEYEVCVGDGQLRYANVKKTVAYVCIEENDDGSAMLEKWNVKTTFYA